ncbi:reverse transcriptase domain-containing protein, partial [Tanacetum coccineum]
DMTITRFGMTPEAIEKLIAQRVAEALANYEATHAANTLEAESQSQNGNDGDNGNGGNRNGNHGNGGNNENGNPNENGRGVMPVARVCTYQDFVKCQPLNFKGTEGVRDLMKLMTEVYCPRNKIEKMETELWNLTVKNNDLAAYTQRFQELTILCTRMVPGEEDRIERQGHFKKDCPKLKNQNHGNKPVIPEARGKAYAIGADQSFVLTTFSTLLDIIPDTLDVIRSTLI